MDQAGPLAISTCSIEGIARDAEIADAVHEDAACVSKSRMKMNRRSRIAALAQEEGDAGGY
jgi:hypothetical protein